MKILRAVYKIFLHVVIVAGFLVVSTQLSRSQSEKPEMQPAWNPQKEMMFAKSVSIESKPFRLRVSESVEEETQKIEKEKEEIKTRVIDAVAKPTQVKKISTQQSTPQISKVQEPAKARKGKAEARVTKPVTGKVVILPKLSPSALLDHTELQAMVNSLDYEILPGKGVRFRYDDLLYDHMGHEWFLEKSRDLRGKTVRIDYRGYVPQEMTFRLSRSSTSAAVEKKVRLEDVPDRIRSIFIEIPSTIPFKDVRSLEFWFDREGAGRSHGDFMIEKVVVLDHPAMAKEALDESRPQPFPFDHPFAATNLMQSEVRGS